MAKQTWNNPIDKTVDWGGDSKTNGLPVSGEQVQKFIKNSLDEKAGVFYYDTANNRYIVFADTDSKDAYLLDPTRTDLILGSFEAPFNYAAEIHLSSPSYNAMYMGATGNYIDFTYDVKNKQGASTGENVIITFTFVRNAAKQTFTMNGKYGEAIHFNVDKYLGEGANTIIIGVTGQNTLAATTVAVTYQVVNIQLTDETDISVAYDLSQGSKVLSVPFSIKGTGTKVVEWYLDGTMLGFVKNEDEVVDIEASRTKNITLSNLQQGKHSLQMRAYTTINGEKFYTPTLYRDIIVYTGVNKDTILAMAMDIPSEYGIVAGNPTIYGVVQYVPYNLIVAAYSPSNKPIIDIEVKMDNNVLGNISTKNGVVSRFSIVSKTFGEKTITLTTEGAAYEIPVMVSETTMDIKEETEALMLDFSAIGKGNDDGWSFGDYTGTFNGFSWIATSGWNNNRLVINAGATFGINFSPLANNPTSKGRTLEFEFKTTSVNDDDAIICDLRNAEGYGLVITATKVALISEAGKTIVNEFKVNEEVRLSIVINKTTGATRKCLAFIYANGCMSRCVNFDSVDSFETDAQISFVGSLGAEVELKQIRVYDTALSDDQILNNYILYRDNVADMFNVYDRNNVYAEGTKTFSPEKMASMLPVMIVTGDVDILENTSDKDTQIVVNIDYINLQDTSKSFTMTNAAMRPQGTSSMGYPKKNFRIYTKMVEETILKDSTGKIVADKLYAFKNNSIPVDTWCLKADYAESSGTHNTGIARMWNNALYNVQLNGEYVCRTDAQKSALSAGYTKDVRTTIDGIPILLFYRKKATDEPIFIGKYNFNNDKSTEKVFGFADIPNFDNSRMQCWEILNNGNDLALFKTIDNFDAGWKEAFESRYPNKSTNVTDLKAFSEWMVGVNGNHERFAVEKWEHFRIYPMAAYYCYLMRHAAVDQLVKNAMLTSEDGEKWYFIQYDNDTINGLINTGEIDVLPTDDRNSVDKSGEYKFAGHDSVLWNMLEADTEFMEIVKAMDDALYSAGISYEECIKVFDEEQADKWVERVYNQDAEYKYVGPYVNEGVNNLFMLQGKRDLHRRWWLAKRFSIYDAKFVSGGYKAQSIELKCMNNTAAGQQITIKAGYPLDYGYGINDLPRVTGVTLGNGESHTFTTSEVVNLGDPIRIYAAPNIEELDLSLMANRLAVVNIAKAYSDSLGTRLKKFILGGEGVNNVEVEEISGLKQMRLLTHLDVRGMKGIKSLDLSSQSYLEELKATGSEIASVLFANGAPVNRLELPATMKVLLLEQLPCLTAENLVLEDISGVHTINVINCPNFSKSFAWVKNWYDKKSTADSRCTLKMDNVEWTNVDANDLINIGKIGTLELKGNVAVTDVSKEHIQSLMEIFGESAFDHKSDFYIDAPAAVFINGRTTVVAGQSEQYSAIVFGAEVKNITWRIYSGGTNATISKDGLLEVAEEYGNGTIVIRTTIETDKETQVVETSVNVRALVFPTQDTATIIGKTTPEYEYENYSLQFASNVTGEVTTQWSLIGCDGYLEIDSYDDASCIVKKIKDVELTMEGSINCEVFKKKDNSPLFSLNKLLIMANPNIAETDQEVCRLLYNKGLCANETYITKAEAAMVSNGDISGVFSGNTNIKSFNGFKYFTSLTSLGTYCFYNCSGLASIELPSGITSLGNYCFSGCKDLSVMTVMATSAPSTKSETFGSTSFSYTGRKTYNTGQNKLYVPAGSTGYDAGSWLDTLCNSSRCGFTLSATL